VRVFLNRPNKPKNTIKMKWTRSIRKSWPWQWSWNDRDDHGQGNCQESCEINGNRFGDVRGGYNIKDAIQNATRAAQECQGRHCRRGRPQGRASGAQGRLKSTNMSFPGFPLQFRIFGNSVFFLSFCLSKVHLLGLDCPTLFSV
jgi:hypothetical protein